MKRFKKMMAIAIVAMMTLMYVVPSMAATNNLTKDGAISVGGLETNDTVNFYQVLEFNADATTTGGWIPTAAYRGTGWTVGGTYSPVTNGLTVQEVQKMLGIDPTTGKPASAADVANTSKGYGISAEMAGRLAEITADAKYTSATDPAVVIANKTATVTNPVAGLYLAKITPGQAGFVYNPVFVGADYMAEPATSSWTLVNMEKSYSPQSMAKKSKLVLEKTADTTGEDLESDGKAATVAVGENVTFFVNTTVPKFSSEYTSPKFIITDVLSAGLDLDDTTIKVYPGTYTSKEALEEATRATDTSAGDPEDRVAVTELTKATTYEVTETSDQGYKLSFLESYLTGLSENKDVTIVYEAKVTSAAATSVNVEDNTVTLNYSNSPSDTEGHGVQKDETKHYTFDIDGNLLGETSYKATEIVKVGLDKNGVEISESRELSNGKKVGALQGAKFKLYVADEEGTLEKKDYQNNTVQLTPYVNDIITATTEITSDVDGRLTVDGADAPGIRGLEVGTYYLVEESAPAGYIKSQIATKIVIDAEFGTETRSEEIGGQTVEWSYPVVTSYTITIDGNKTADYTITNSSTIIDTSVTHGDTGLGDMGDSAGKINNTQGVELPSTGGMGTTLFYIIGAILIIGAGVLLVTRRRTENAE